jgi:hypothetical protein
VGIEGTLSEDREATRVICDAAVSSEEIVRSREEWFAYPMPRGSIYEVQVSSLGRYRHRIRLLHSRGSVSGTTPLSSDDVFDRRPWKMGLPRRDLE